MLELRPQREACDRDLPPDSEETMIRAFECTFCRHCAETGFSDTCRNCGGNGVARPIRSVARPVPRVGPAFTP